MSSEESESIGLPNSMSDLSENKNSKGERVRAMKHGSSSTKRQRLN